MLGTYPEAAADKAGHHGTTGNDYFSKRGTRGTINSTTGRAGSVKTTEGALEREGPPRHAVTQEARCGPEVIKPFQGPSGTEVWPVAWGVPLSRANRPDGSRLSRSRAHHAGQPGCPPPPRLPPAPAPRLLPGPTGAGGPRPAHLAGPRAGGRRQQPNHTASCSPQPARVTRVTCRPGRPCPAPRPAPPRHPHRDPPSPRPRPAPLTGTRPARSRAVAARPGEGGSLP